MRHKPPRGVPSAIDPDYGEYGMSQDETFYPTVAFGFSRDRLHQMWLGTMGTIDWRPVPMIELGKEPPKPAAVAGWVDAEDEGE